MSKPNHKKQQPQIERRYLPSAQAGNFEIRQTATGRKIVGYGAKFSPVLSDDLGGFRERIDPGAFNANLARNPDVRGLINHDPNLILGRTTSGTLRLSTDAIGLKYELDAPDTQAARDLIVSMERGDITQSSFGFICTDDKWEQDATGQIIRTVLKADLFDVSPVTFPAYPDATSGVRASLRSCPSDLRSKLKAKRDDDEECPDGQTYDETLDSCIDDSEDLRCQFRCAEHRDTTWKNIAGFADDDVSACAFRCGQCVACRSAHSNIGEDDPSGDIRAHHRRLLALL